MEHLLKIFRLLKYSFLFLFFTKDYSLKKYINSKNNFIVIISPWSFSATPYFFIKIGKLLNKNNNNNVTFIFDNIPYNYWYKLNITILKFFINWFKIPYENLYNHKFSKITLNTATECEILEELAYENYISTTRGEFNQENFKLFKKSFLKQSSSVFNHLEEIISKNKESVFILGGGSYGTSGLFVFKLNKLNANYFTIDSGFGIISCCYKGIASKQQNINEIEILNYKKFIKAEDAIKYSEELIDNRKYNKNISLYHEQFQLNNFVGTSKFNNYFVFYLNTIWDSAAFIHGTLNKDYLSSIEIVVDNFLNNSKDNLIIRIHPHERNWWGKSNFDYKKYLFKFEKYYNRRLFFIQSNDEVNSYDLLLNSKGSIIWSSTIGLESIILNLPTIFIAKSYITNINSIGNHLTNNINDLNNFFINPKYYKPNTATNLDSRFVYTITQNYTWLKSPFTPQSRDFLKWIKLKESDLDTDKSVKLIISALENNNQLTYEILQDKFPIFEKSS
jgi:hypothetical protein